MKSLLLILFAIPIFAIQPIVNVGDLPNDSQLEAYELSEEIFSMKVLEYYNKALMLKSQIQINGEVPLVKLTEPSFEELSDLELDVIIKYYKIAKDLEKQVESLTGLSQSEEIINLKKEIILTKKNYSDSLWEVKNSYLLRELKIKEKSDSICNERINQIEESLNSGCPDCINYFSIGVTENLFFADGDGLVNSEPNLGFQVSINALKIFGFGKSISFWYEYQAPRFTTDVTFNDQTQEMKWSSNLSAAGISGEFFPLLDMGKFKNGIKAGLGYFWSDGNIYNTIGNNYSWEGLKFNLEYFGGSSDSKYPFEIFIGAQIFQSVSDEFTFNLSNGNVIEIGNTNIGIYAGLRYNFWTSPF
jgi:hypothetical protein